MKVQNAVMASIMFLLPSCSNADGPGAPEQMTAAAQPQAVPNPAPTTERALPAPSPLPEPAYPWNVPVIGHTCPEGIWAPIKGYDPPGNEFAKKAAEDERTERAARLRTETFKLKRDSHQIAWSAYDFKKQRYTLTVPSLFKCNGPEGQYTHSRWDRNALFVPVGDSNIMIAVTKPTKRPNTMTTRTGEKVKIGREWTAGDLSIELPVPEADAQAFREGNRTAHVEFAVKFGAATVDSKMQKFSDVPTPLDVGAGPVITAEVVGMRVVKPDGVVVWEKETKSSDGSVANK